MNIPFSAYDFFGYLANGFLMVCAFEYAFFGTSLAEREWKVGNAAFYLVVAYVVGHIVANISRTTSLTTRGTTAIFCF